MVFISSEAGAHGDDEAEKVKSVEGESEHEDYDWVGQRRQLQTRRQTRSLYFSTGAVTRGVACVCKVIHVQAFTITTLQQNNRYKK